MTIDELDTNYCDDFECNSSPAIEQTIRSLARDLTRLKYTIRLFQPDVQYSDGFRSFRGSDKYSRPFWPRDSVTDPRVRVTAMRMVDPGTAEVKWQLCGKVGVFPVDIPMTTTVQLNLVTGRVLQHNEGWDLSALSPPAAAAAVASRMAWSARQASQDAGEGLNKAAESLSSLTSMDDDQYYQNPTDPTRFFQQNNSERNDAINIALVVAGLYLVFKVYSELEGLH